MESKKIFDVTEYGVLPDCGTLQTAAIQQVLEDCREAGGGEVVFPAGTYYIGSLRLYSNMTLRLLQGARLAGSRNHKDYEDFHVPSTMRYITDEFYIKAWNLPPYYIYGILCAFGEEDISIIGEEGAVIDGQDCFDANGEEKFRGPMGIVLSQCKNVRLEGYTFINSANWSHQMDSCEHVRIQDVTVLAGHDGFNLHHSKDIEISGCRLETGDDCFAGYDVENLTVRRCYANTACNSMRIGGCGLRFLDCIFEGPGYYPHISERTYHTHAVFKYYSIRSDVISRDAEDILFKDCVISDVSLLLSYQYRKEGLHQDNRPLRSLTFDHVKISKVSRTSFFRGNGESCRLTFRNSMISFDGGEKVAFLELDDSIELIIEQVDFCSKTKVKAGKDSTVMMRECSNVAIER